jgi:hypothetical protein
MARFEHVESFLEVVVSRLERGLLYLLQGEAGAEGLHFCDEDAAADAIGIFVRCPPLVCGVWVQIYGIAKKDDTRSPGSRHSSDELWSIK